MDFEIRQYGFFTSGRLGSGDGVKSLIEAFWKDVFISEI
jgi:hypothetical protein